MQQNCEKAEPVVLRTVQISETIFPADDIRITMSVTGLCTVYTPVGQTRQS
jgi:hypothetical protein